MLLVFVIRVYLLLLSTVGTIQEHLHWSTLCVHDCVVFVTNCNSSNKELITDVTGVSTTTFSDISLKVFGINSLFCYPLQLYDRFTYFGSNK